MKKSDFVYCDCCECDVAIPHNSADCAEMWERECKIARRGLAKLKNERRERIATAAMQGMLSNPNIVNDKFKENLIASWAVDCADALIAELDKQEGGE